jgi:hypothetical protein
MKYIIDSCLSCKFFTHVIGASQWKKSGQEVPYCRHYERELPFSLRLTEKPDFCKVISITIEESN